MPLDATPSIHGEGVRHPAHRGLQSLQIVSERAADTPARTESPAVTQSALQPGTEVNTWEELQTVCTHPTSEPHAPADKRRPRACAEVASFLPIGEEVEGSPDGEVYECALEATTHLRPLGEGIGGIISLTTKSPQSQLAHQRPAQGERSM